MTEAHEEQEPDPVEEERGHECCAEHEIISQESSISILLPVYRDTSSFKNLRVLQDITDVQLI